jgi:hypothetical protein
VCVCVCVRTRTKETNIFLARNQRRPKAPAGLRRTWNLGRRPVGAGFNFVQYFESFQFIRSITRRCVLAVCDGRQLPADRVQWAWHRWSGSCAIQATARSFTSHQGGQGQSGAHHHDVYTNSRVTHTTCHVSSHQNQFIRTNDERPMAFPPSHTHRVSLTSSVMVCVCPTWPHVACRVICTCSVQGDSLSWQLNSWL